MNAPMTLPPLAAVAADARDPRAPLSPHPTVSRPAAASVRQATPAGLPDDMRCWLQSRCTGRNLDASLLSAGF